MTIISALQTYIKTCYELKSGRPVWINYLGTDLTEYSIVPTPGASVLEAYVTGVKIMEYTFSFQSAESTADDIERLANVGFFEEFKDWMDVQTLSGNLPVLGTGKTSIAIEAVNGGYLFEQGDSGSGIYQIDCRLEYRQEKVTEVSE
jgi:hypothetical protein